MWLPIEGDLQGSDSSFVMPHTSLLSFEEIALSRENNQRGQKNPISRPLKNGCGTRLSTPPQLRIFAVQNELLRCALSSLTDLAKRSCERAACKAKNWGAGSWVACLSVVALVLFLGLLYLVGAVFFCYGINIINLKEFLSRLLGSPKKSHSNVSCCFADGNVWLSQAWGTAHNTRDHAKWTTPSLRFSALFSTQRQIRKKLRQDKKRND